MNYLKTEEEIEAFSKAPGTVNVIKYGAPWCPPCREVAPYYALYTERCLSRGLSVRFATVDIDDVQEYAQKKEIKKIPRFEAWRNEKMVGFLMTGDITMVDKMVETSLQMK